MTNIEAEGSELILKNSDGTVAIVPKNRRDEVLRHIRNGNHKAIDDIVNTLPKHSDYAADGTVISGRSKRCPKGVKKGKLYTKDGESALFNHLQDRYDDAETALTVYDRITGDQYTAVAQMKNGEPVVRDGNIVKTTGTEVPIDPKPTVPTVKDRAKASPFVSDMVRRLEAILPGVTVELTDGPEKGSVGNGTLRLNAEKMTADTPFHELTHPLLAVMEKVNPKGYVEIVNEAKAILRAHPSINSMLSAKYSGLSEKGKIDEAIAYIAGILGADMVADMNPTETISINSSIWDRITGLVNKFFNHIENVFRRLYGLPKSDRITQLTTLRDVAKYVSDMVAQKDSVPQSIIEAIHSMDTEYSHPDTIANISELNSLLFGEGDLGLDEQVKRIMMGIRTTAYGRVAYVNGEKVRYDKGKSDSEIEYDIRSKLSLNTDYNAELKKQLMDWVNIHNMDMTSDVLGRIFGSNDNGPMVSRAMLKAFMRTMDIEPGMKIHSFSELSALPIIPDELKPYFNASVLGNDPLVAINYSKDGKAIVSLYDVTLGKIYQSKDVGRLGSIWQRISKKKASYLQNNELGTRRLMLATAANFLMSASDGKIQVKESIVIGVNDHKNPLHGSIDANMVDMVRANEDIKTLGQLRLDNGKKVSEIFDNPALREIFSGNDLRVDRADYWTLLTNYWSKQDADFLARRGLNNKQRIAGLTPFEKKELIEKQLRYIKGLYTTIGSDGSYMMGEHKLQDNIEFRYLTKELQNLHNMNVLDYQINSHQQMSDFTKLISPTHSINDERLSTFKMAVRQIIDKIYTKIMDHANMIDDVTKVYQDAFGTDMTSRMADKWGDDLYDKAVGRITISDENGNKHTQKINHILWTTDESLDPMLSMFPELKAQAMKLPKSVLEANSAFCDAITEKMVDVVQHINEVQMDRMEGMSREDARNNLMSYTSYRKGFIPLMSKTVNSMFWSQGYKAAMEKQTGVWANHNSSYDQMTHEQRQMNREYDSVTSSFIDQLGLFGTSYTVLRDAKTGKSFNLTKKQMDILGVAITDKGDFVSTDRTANASVTTNLEMVGKNFLATMDRKIEYESHIIPLYHGVKAVLMDDRENKGAKDADALEEWIELYCDSVVFGRGRDIKNAPKLNAAIVGTTKTLTALTMAGNLSIGAASGFVDLWGTLSEALATNAYGMFKATDVVKASAWCLKHPSKAFQLVFHYRVANMSEHDAVNFYLNNKTKRNIFSDFWVYFPNWVTDTFARSVILTAKMMHDGSFAAHSFNEKGEVVYDIKKDARYYKNGQMIESQKPYIENLRANLASQGVSENYGYDFREQQNIRTFVAKHVIGAFDAADKAQISSFVLAKPFMMFRTFVTSKIDNMLAQGQFMDEMGKWKYDEKEGVMQWERAYFEGQLRTCKTLFEIAKSDGPFIKGLNPVSLVKGYSELNDTQKANVRRMLVKVGMFAVLSLLYGFGVDDDKDKDDIGFIPERQFVKTFKYSYQDLLSFTWMYQTITNPSAASSMIERLFDQRYGDGWKRAINMVKPVTSVDNVYNLFTGESLLKPNKDEK